MIFDKLLHQLEKESLHTEIHFDEVEFTLTTVTTILGKEVSRITADMTPMYLAFRDRLEEDWYGDE